MAHHHHGIAQECAKCRATPRRCFRLVNDGCGDCIAVRLGNFLAARHRHLAAHFARAQSCCHFMTIHCKVAVHQCEQVVLVVRQHRPNTRCWPLARQHRWHGVSGGLRRGENIAIPRGRFSKGCKPRKPIRIDLALGV